MIQSGKGAFLLKHAVVSQVSSESVQVRPLRHHEMRPLAEAIEETSEAQIANRWREQDSGYRELLGVEVEGVLVGTVSIREVRDVHRSLHLFALEVATELRGRGIGAAIVNFVIEEARLRDCDRVTLEVYVENPARRLYHRLGFRRVGGAFLNSWLRFNDDGSRDRQEEMSYRMIKRLK